VQTSPTDRRPASADSLRLQLETLRERGKPGTRLQQTHRLQRCEDDMEGRGGPHCCPQAGVSSALPNMTAPVFLEGITSHHSGDRCRRGPRLFEAQVQRRCRWWCGARRRLAVTDQPCSVAQWLLVARYVLVRFDFDCFGFLSLPITTARPQPPRAPVRH
jgi:hypothetical protein